MTTYDQLTAEQKAYYYKLTDSSRESYLSLISQGYSVDGEYARKGTKVKKAPLSVDAARARGPVTDSGRITSEATLAIDARRAAAASEGLVSVATQSNTVRAATLQTGAQISTPKDPKSFPTAEGGALDGQIIAAAGNAMNQITLDAYRASGGTTTSTYTDKYTLASNKGETALQEAARTQAAGTIAIFNKVAAAAGKPQMVVSNITGKNTETAKATLVKPAPVLSSAVVSGQAKTAAQVVPSKITPQASILAAPATASNPTVSNPLQLGISDFFSKDPFQIVNPAILQTPEQKKQLEALPSIVKDITGYLEDQKKIAAMPKQPATGGGWLDNLKLPSLSLPTLTLPNLGVGDTISSLEKSVKDLLALPGQTIAAEKTTAQAVSTGTLLVAAAIGYMLLKKK